MGVMNKDRSGFCAGAEAGKDTSVEPKSKGAAPSVDNCSSTWYDCLKRGQIYVRYSEDLIRWISIV